jgi:hypothetical protein
MLHLDDSASAPKWSRLASRASGDVCRSSGALWDSARRVYIVDCLADQLELDPEARTVAWSAGSVLRHDKPPKRDLALLVLEYLANAVDVPPSGRWVSPKELPNGAFFFRGPHEVPAEMIARRFGDSPSQFLEKSATLGGVSVPTGPDCPADAASRFRVLPRIDVLILLWAADDEFPARASILFDSTIADRLALDGVLLLAMVLVLELIRC